MPATHTPADINYFFYHLVCSLILSAHVALPLSLCSYHVVKKACCFTLQRRSPLPPPDHCQWESPSNPCCLARHRLTLPPHICMSCGVSAKVYSDVMGPDGSIFPADSDDCQAQVYLCVCVCTPSEPALHVMGLCPSWLVSPLHLRESAVRIQHGSCRFARLPTLLPCSLCSISPGSLSSCPHFFPFFH